MFCGKHFTVARANIAVALMMSFGLFVLVSGKVWFTSGSARNAQIYIWLLLPTLLLFVYYTFKKASGVIEKQYIPWIAFLIFVATSSYWGTQSGEAFTFVKKGLLIFLFLLSIYFFMRINEPFFQRALLVAVLIVALGALATIFYQFFWLERPLGYREFRLDRLGIGEFANYRHPVAAGIFHGAIATWAFGAAVNKKSSFRAAILWFSVFSILALFVFFTYSRAAWIGLACALAVSTFLHNTKRAKYSLVLGVVIVTLAAFIWANYLMMELFHRKLSGRGPIWEYYFSIMPGHWLWGYGLGTPFEYHWPDPSIVSPHAHSLYLQQIYDSGIVSLALLGSGLLTLIRKSWKLRNNYWVRLAFPALVFSLVAMLTDVERIFTRPGDYWTVFWLPVAILLAIPKNSKDEPKID